jgi:predicted ATP-dependent endonuclease of OLD family
MYIQIDDNFDKELKDAEYFDVNNQEELVSFGPINKVNLFVGANNSGKSRFLRNIILSNEHIITKNHFLLKSYIESIQSVTNEPRANTVLSESAFYIEYNNSNKLFQNSSEEENFPYLKKYFLDNKHKVISLERNKLDKLRKILKNVHETKTYGALFSFLEEHFLQIAVCNEILINKLQSNGLLPLRIDHVSSYFATDIMTCYKALQPIYEENINTHKKTSSYIPILRSAQIIWADTHIKLDQSAFKRTVSMFYNIGQNNIKTGLDFYDEIKRARNERKEIRKGFEAFEKFIGETFFDTTNFEIVAKEASSENEKYINVFINGEERDIHHLGDGIQALLILLYPIYTAENGSWIFIEEPEINLHPAMQRIFIEQLTTNLFLKEKNLKYFITTHSNHLLDLSMEIENEVSIFTFNKTQAEEGKYRFNIKNVKGADTEILSLLGVKNSSVFMANSTIWVEGITDRQYIKAFLNAFHNAKENKGKTVFKEDLHYAFFEYAGSNIMHYIFDEPEKIEDDTKIKAQFLSNKIFLISDKDLNKEAKHLLFEGQENKNFHYEKLEVKEIENIFSEVQLKKILPLLFDTITEEDIQSKRFEFEKYKEKFIGNYLKTKFKEKIKDSYLTDSEALSTYYKNRLAKIISEEGFMVWEEMSAPAKQLTENIYNFISASNT